MFCLIRDGNSRRVGREGKLDVGAKRRAMDNLLHIDQEMLQYPFI